MLHDKIHIHDWVNFDHAVTKNMEIGDLKSYTHDLIKIDTIIVKLMELNTSTLLLAYSMKSKFNEN